MSGRGGSTSILSKLWLIGFRSLCFLLFALSVVAVPASVVAVAYSVAEFGKSGWFGVFIAILCLVVAVALARVGWLGFRIKSRAEIYSAAPAFPRLRGAIERWLNG